MLMYKGRKLVQNNLVCEVFVEGWILRKIVTSRLRSNKQHDAPSARTVIVSLREQLTIAWSRATGRDIFGTVYNGQEVWQYYRPFQILFEVPTR